MIQTVGSRALIVDLPDLDTVMNWHASLVADPLPHQTDVIAAARTVLITFDSPSATRQAMKTLESFSAEDAEKNAPRDIVIDVLYDGEDLDDVADVLGISREAVIDWHTSTTWVAAFGGFAPGFTYCVAEDDADARSIPRRSSPRTEVPAGSVGLAGEFSAVYPRPSPGGWQLLGRTTDPLWDSAATPPALVMPGDRVRYNPVSTLDTSHAPSRFTMDRPPRRPLFTIDDIGLQTLYQDLGRQGNGNLGVTTSGSADRAAARTANAAVGNKRNATLLENIGAMQLTALAETVICITGAEAEVTVNDRGVPLATPLIIPAGATVTVGPATLGMRNYLAVRGGLIADTELDSAATDLLSGLGPAPLQPGDTVAASLSRPDSANALLSNPLRVEKKDGVTHGTLRVIPGPRDAWFGDGLQKFLETTWTVTAESNRVGLRLTGPEPIQRTRDGELPSEGMVAGSIQIPPNGQPVVFLRDHAVTGGYPVIATVLHEDVDIAAQLPPESQVTFELYSEGNE